MARSEPQGEEEGTAVTLEPAEKAKALISALNLVSRNLPLPPDLFNSVSSIYRNDTAAAEEEKDDNTEKEVGVQFGGYGDLLIEFDEAMSMQREKFSSSSVLDDSWKTRFQGRISRRMKEIEELPCTRGEDVQTKCLLEFYGLKLRDLQSKVRSEVSSEYWLRVHCASLDKQLFDWGQARVPRPMYGLGDVFAMEADDQFRKKRDAERLSRLEEEERNHVETKKRMFFAEIMNAVREYTLQLGASQKRRKQRNDFVLVRCCKFCWYCFLW